MSYYHFFKKRDKSIFLSLAVVIPFITLLLSTSSVSASPIDLTEGTGGFVVSDPNYVVFGTNPNEVTLFEDDFFGATFLSNDPFLNDPGIFISANMSTLTFDLDFTSIGNANFEVNLLDPLGGDPFFNLFHDGTVKGAGSFQYHDVTVDLVALNLLETTIGLEFNLTSNLGQPSFDSVLQISNVALNEGANPVPEPSSMLLFGLGLLFLTGYRKNAQLNQ